MIIPKISEIDGEKVQLYYAQVDERGLPVRVILPGQRRSLEDHTIYFTPIDLTKTEADRINNLGKSEEDDYVFKTSLDKYSRVIVNLEAD